jgi:hypothetical protein
MSDTEKQVKSERLKRALDLWSAHQDLLRARFVHDVPAPDRELLAQAEEFHSAVAPYRKQFVAAGAPPDFLETLQQNIDGLRRAVAKFDR